MSNKFGWIGTLGQVLHYLSVVGADKDEQGRYILSGQGIPTFMGMDGDNAECIVSAEVCYHVGGRPVPLAPGLRSTSYGLGVTVIA